MVLIRQQVSLLHRVAQPRPGPAAIPACMAVQSPSAIPPPFLNPQHATERAALALEGPDCWPGWPRISL